MPGFFLLDDPFTDMDAARRAAAVQAIGTFAENHQVLFFTCHPEHAGELEGLAGAKKPEGDGMTRHPLHYPPSTS